jgi:L-lactate dehydrogenase complex protein LldG
VSGREAILGRIRQSLGVPADDAARTATVAKRLARPPKGIIPARGQLDQEGRIALFSTMAEQVFASVRRVKATADVPKAVAEYLRSRNLPSSVRMGDDPRLAAMPWWKQKALQVKSGASDGEDEAGVSHAFGAVAESGTLVMASGPDNPTTVNFLPEHHIVVVDAGDIDGDLETVLGKIRKAYGKRRMPRTVNLITGPSRSGDIEQKLLLGAHGPRAVHIIVVGG